MDSSRSHCPLGTVFAFFFCLQGGSSVSSAYPELSFACSVILVSLLLVRCQKVLLYSVEFGAPLLFYALCRAKDYVSITNIQIIPYAVSSTLYCMTSVSTRFLSSNSNTVRLHLALTLNTLM